MMYYLEEPDFTYNDLRKNLTILLGEDTVDYLYKEFKSGNRILSATREDYERRGVAHDVINQLMAARNLIAEPEPQIKSSKDAYHNLLFLRNEAVEHMAMLVLSRSNHVIGTDVMFTGGTAGVTVDVKVLCKKILNYSLASTVILAHNHPSGNEKPSELDIRITTKIVNALSLIDVKVFDHIIVTRYGYYSFADNCIMPEVSQDFLSR